MAAGRAVAAAPKEDHMNSAPRPDCKMWDTVFARLVTLPYAGEKLPGKSGGWCERSGSFSAALVDVTDSYKEKTI